MQNRAAAPVALPSSLRPFPACLPAKAARNSARRGRGAMPPRAGAAAEQLPPARPTGGALVRRQRQQSPPWQPREDTWSLEDVAEDFEHDVLKEQGRRHMRKLSTFTFRRWALHRSTARYARHMSGIFHSRIVLGLAQPLLSVGSLAALVCVYERALQEGQLPTWLPTFLMPSLPFDITSFALSLLLVFRTNSSYDRWQQALSAWGDICNRSRDTLRQLLAANARSGSGQGGASRAVLSAAASARWLVAFSRALKAQLTEDSDLEAELQGVLSEGELSLLLAAQHRPAFALAVLTELADGAPLRDAQRSRVDENFTLFADACGRCEHLLRTPIPLSYTRHTSRFMVIWLSVLPLGLWPYCGFGAVPVTVVISFLLLGIEEIGVAIEEPFGILPLEDICQELEASLADMLEQTGASKAAAKQAAAAVAAAAAAPEAVTAATKQPAADRAAAGMASETAAAAGNVTPFPRAGAFWLGRGGMIGGEDVAASTIFDSFDETDR